MMMCGEPSGRVAGYRENMHAAAVATLSGTTVSVLVERHRRGDWGMVDAVQTARNQESRRTGAGGTVSLFRRTVDIWVTTDERGNVAVMALTPQVANA